MYSKSTPFISQLFYNFKHSKTVQHFHLPSFRLNNNEKFNLVIFFLIKFITLFFFFKYFAVFFIKKNLFFIFKVTKKRTI